MSTETDRLSQELRNKIKAEYAEFMQDLKAKSREEIIEMSYETDWKESISIYIERERLGLTEDQYNALLNSKNALAEIYADWISNGFLETYQDLGQSIRDTADAILVSMSH